MNREQLSDAIGRLDERMIEETMTARRRRRPWWVAAVAVAACVCLAVGMVTVWPHLKPQGVTPPIDGGAVTQSTKGGNNTVPTNKPNNGQPSVSHLAYALAQAQYPQMAQRPADDYGDAYDLWWDSVRVQRKQAEGQTDGMTDYYAETMAQFLVGEAGENRVYSPLNVYLALAMLAETAEGNSRAQILDLLGVSDLTALREKCSALWNGVYVNDGAVTSLLANSLWLSDSDYWQCDMDTVNALAEHYYASTFEGEMGSEEYNHANYAAEKGGFSGECKLIGHFRHTAAPMLNNFIDLTLVKSAWNITGEGWLNALTVESLEDLAADKPVTIHVKALTVGGEVYGDGTYTSGNVTIEVDTTVIEVKDNGIVDAGQTYGNVKYAIVAVMEDGTPNSKAIAVRRQNYVDGNLYFTVMPAEGYKVVSVVGEGGTLSANTAGGEVEAYDQVIVPVLGNKEMSVTVTVAQ